MLRLWCCVVLGCVPLLSCGSGCRQDLVKGRSPVSLHPYQTAIHPKATRLLTGSQAIVKADSLKKFNRTFDLFLKWSDRIKISGVNTL